MQTNSNGNLSTREVIAGYEPLEALMAPKLLTDNTRRGSMWNGKILQRTVKLTALFITIACLQVSARTNAQRLSISIKNSPLEKLFSLIEQKTSYVFFYDAAILKGTKPVTVEAQDAAVEEILRTSFKGQSLDFTIQDKTIFIKREEVKTPVVMSVAPGDGTNSISGIVRSETGTPLAGATVVIRKLKRSGMTDAKGEFILKDVPNGEYWVEVSFVGYENFGKMITVENHEARVDAQMKQSISSLDETVIKGYYNTTKRLNTGDVTTVKGEDIQKQPVSDPILALEGRVPGLYIQQTSGVPGAYSTIQIRGQNSIANGNDPLYIVDGVPFSSTSLTSTAIPGGVAGTPSPIPGQGVGQGLSPFNNLNPADIESIEVLKDADATAIYGSRGANGVILITTRKGKAGNTKFDLNAFTGVGKVTRRMKLLNTQQYLEMRHEGFNNDAITPTTANAPDLLTWDTTRYTDWQEVMMGNPDRFNNIQASLSGGSAGTQFAINGGYSKQGTVFPGNYSDQKGSFHVSITNVSPDYKFHSQFSAGFVHDYSNLPQTNFVNYINLAPDAPAIYNANGKLNWQLVNGSLTWNNPLGNTYLQANSSTDNLTSNLNLSYQLLPGLELKSSFGYNSSRMNQAVLSPAGYYPYPYNTDPTIRSNNTATTNFQSWIIEPQISFKKRIENGQFEILVGTSFQQNDQNSTWITASGFASDALIKNVSAASTTIAGLGAATLYRYNALFGRINYNWMDKYLFNLTARRDGSSRFGPGKQFGNFGAIGVGWIFSKEKFIQNGQSFLSYGKLRASYGITGNDQILDYQYLSSYSPYAQSYQSLSGLYPTALTNPTLAWEIVKKLEGGLELGFLNDRLLLTSNYYRNRTGNQLVGYLLPQLTGFSSIQANLPAIVQNSGFEFTLNTINVKRKNFNWSSSINVSVPKNKLVAYPGLASSTYSSVYVIGQPISVRRSFYYSGVNPQTGVYSFATKNSNGIPSAPTDQSVIQPVIQNYYGGFQNSFSYKGFVLDIFLQFVKQKKINYLPYFTVPGVYTGNSLSNQPTLVLQRWQKPGDITNIQKFGALSNSTIYAYVSGLIPSNAIVTDGSFIRLKNLALSYQLAADWLKKAHLQNMKLYIQCQNLITFTKYLGLDPETGGINLPPVRMVTGGIQLSL